MRIYKHNEETPKQINPTGLKRFLKSSRFPRHIRFGWETEPTGPGAETVIFSKTDTYGAIRKSHLLTQGKYSAGKRAYRSPCLRISTNSSRIRL